MSRSREAELNWGVSKLSQYRTEILLRKLKKPWEALGVRKGWVLAVIAPRPRGRRVATITRSATSPREGKERKGKLARDLLLLLILYSSSHLEIIHHTCNSLSLRPSIISNNLESEQSHHPVLDRSRPASCRSKRLPLCASSRSRVAESDLFD